MECPRCGKPAIRWGFYERTDAKLACGNVLDPIPIRRWRCNAHGTFSFLPPFLARYTHYLAKVVAVVLECIIDDGKDLDTLFEVSGPSVDTVRRWVCELAGPPQQRWICQRCGEANNQRSKSSSPLPEPSRILAMARVYAQQMKMNQIYFPTLLQRARLSNMTRYKFDANFGV